MNGIKALRVLSLLEGISLLALVFVAMPLKYIWALPLAVRIVGLAHGVLFLALLAICIQVLVEGSLRTTTVGKVFAWCLVPFGFVAAERLIRPSDSQ